MYEYLYLFGDMCKNRYSKSDELNHVSWPELFYYSLRQFFHFKKRTFTTSIETYRIYNDELAVITLSGKEIFLPKSMDMDTLTILLREALDKQHWHQFDTPYTPVKSDDIIVDCGASEGIWASLAIDKAKKIYLVEPQKEFQKSLEKTFNSYIEKGKAEILKCAVGNTEGECSISSSTLSGSVEYNSNGNIPLYKLDTLFKDKKISFIKADIEGFELELLKGATNIIKRDKPKIAVTIYHTDNNWQEIKDYLLSIVPEYNWIKRGIVSWGKPMMLHAWIE